MSAIYDNWERLVAAALKKQQLWELFHQQSRSPSIRSEASDFSSSSSRLSSCWQQIEDVVAELREAPPKLVLVSDFSPPFDAENVFLASAELLGRGTLGNTYVAVMERRVKFVIKRLNSAVNISEQDFKRHMEIVGNVRHENVAALRAYYCSEEERLMLYDYYNHGSVSALLHGRVGENPNHVDWETRLTIAIGVARGIAEIHRQNGGELVHGNIKSSNIFLNPQNYGCVSDLGLASTIAPAFTQNAWCYAPEFKNSQNVSQASDVYSFGILLLELLTRKSPVYVPDGPEAVNLVKLVNSLKSKVRTARVFDTDLLKDPTIREHMVKLLQIGISCATKSPKKRPKMSEVVMMLEDLRTMSTGSSATGTLQENLVFVENGIPTFNLRDMLRASAETLGKGTFGSSYKAILENGETITVKRLKDANITFKYFQQHMEVIGRMRQENVGALRAYYFHRDEMLFVYDYLSEDSLFALLHGNKGTGRRALDWESRLKIAVGAARGIAYIHRQDGWKLVHGNVKSSNIFFNGKQYGLVSDAGLAKVAGPVRFSAMRNPGYCAPEVKDTRNVSQASDVYSFGVVLLELVTGKQSEYTPGKGKVNSLVEWIQSLTPDQWAAAGVFDVELLRRQTGEESMVELLQIGLDCVTKVPERRPKIPQVVKMLEEISGIDTGERPFTESRLEDFQPYESRFEDVLEDLLARLTL